MTNHKILVSQEFLLNMAHGKQCDTEYDGRMYTLCAYCDCNLTDGDHKHSDDCEMIVAREFLGDVWISVVNEQKKKFQQEENRKSAAARKHVWNKSHHDCKHCEKSVLGSAMKAHFINDFNCMLIQGKIKSGAISCMCCHRSMLLSDFEGHSGSANCLAKRDMKDLTDGTSCLCCHKVLSSEKIDEHYHSKKCISNKV